MRKWQRPLMCEVWLRTPWNMRRKRTSCREYNRTVTSVQSRLLSAHVCAPWIMQCGVDLEPSAALPLSICGTAADAGLSSGPTWHLSLRQIRQRSEQWPCGIMGPLFGSTDNANSVVCPRGPQQLISGLGDEARYTYSATVKNSLV